jgi:NAD kinase|tara:strand:- start:120261 stop:121076 length:816 start_codon:yes stop_codon:yes gene_type:complete
MGKSENSTGQYHFIANPADATSIKLRDKMIAAYGQAAADKAPTRCAIGGDGSLLFALRDAFNKTVIGQCSTESNSVGFWMNHVDPKHLGLDALVASAHKYTLKPLRVKIMHDDGSSALRYAFTDAALMSNNGQASLAHVQDLDVAENNWRVMGNGITFATPLGSTAKSYTEGGSALDLTLPAFLMTGSGVCSPLNFKSFVHPADASLFVSINTSRAKRDQRIDIDGVTYVPPKGRSIEGLALTTETDTTKHATLLLDRPARSAFRKLTIDM